jgi:hypothetical protein
MQVLKFFSPLQKQISMVYYYYYYYYSLLVYSISFGLIDWDRASIGMNRAVSVHVLSKLFPFFPVF